MDTKQAVMFVRTWEEKTFFEIRSELWPLVRNHFITSSSLSPGSPHYLYSSAVNAQPSIVLFLWMHTWGACSHCLSANVTSAISVVIYAIDKQGDWRTSLHFFYFTSSWQLKTSPNSTILSEFSITLWFYRDLF